MNASFKATLSRLVAATPLAYWPVRVRAGLARGARWTLLPYSAYWRGEGERDVLAAIRSLGDLQGKVCWDLGAHFGIYTVGLAMAVGPQGQVAAFEPDPQAHRRCARHVRMNQLQHVRLYAAAVSDHETDMNLIQNEGAGATTGHFAYRDEQPATDSKGVTVHTVVLDALVAAGEIRLPDFVKIDVEGHGASALRGALKSLANRRPAIVMSFHSTDELEGAQTLLEPLGYRCFTAEDQRPQTWADAVFKTALLRAV